MPQKQKRYSVYENLLGEVVLKLCNGMKKFFWCPPNGGYIREISFSEDFRSGMLGQQICDGLYHTGQALYASERSSMIKIIRKELRTKKGQEHLNDLLLMTLSEDEIFVKNLTSRKK